MHKTKKTVVDMPAFKEEKTLCKACNKVCEPDILEAVNDPLTGVAFSLVRCSSCGLGRTEPQPVDLAPYYPAAYYGGRHGATAGFCVGRRLRLLNTSSHYLISLLNLLPQCPERDEVKRLSKETKIWRSGHMAEGRRLLDIGCGDGSFLLAAQAQGWVVAGVERFPDDARQKGLEVFCDVGELISGRDGGSLSSGRSDRPPFAFDCITLWHSLEHIADPFALLKEAGALLNPGGRVIVAVPDNGGWQARLFGRFWLHLDVPRHLWHFTLPALREAFQRAGLEVTQTVHQEFEYDVLGWSQSALNALFKTPNVFFNWLTKKPTGVGTPMLVVQVALGVIFAGLSVPLVWLGSLFRRGGTLVVVGRVRSSKVLKC